MLEFDRSEPLGYGARLDYRVVANWVIAEYKSQGLLQTEMNAVERELFHVFALNEPAAARALFARLGGARAEPVLESRWRPFRALPAPSVCPIPR